MAWLFPTNFGVNTTDITNNISNTVTQIQNTQCISNVTDNASNNTIIVNGSVINGNFTGVTFQSSSDASCAITTSMDDIVTSIMGNLVTQNNKSESDLFNDFSNSIQFNSTNITNNISSNITQINESLCSSNLVESFTGNYIFISDSKVNGNFIGVAGASTGSATCTMNNYIKNATYNSIQNSVSQSNTSEGIFGALLGMLQVVIITITIGVVLLGIIGSIAAAYIKVKKPTDPITTQDFQDFVRIQNNLKGNNITTQDFQDFVRIQNLEKQKS
jgi:hypothetical protein